MKNKIILVLMIITLFLLVTLESVYGATTKEEDKDSWGRSPFYRDDTNKYVGERGICERNYPGYTCMANMYIRYKSLGEFSGTENNYSYYVEKNGKKYHCISGREACINDGKKTFCCGEKTKDACCKEISPLDCTQAGGIEVEDKKEEIRKRCAGPLITGVEVAKGKVCCVPKEQEREKVKKPGRLGRLESCFGRYWLWGKESEEIFLDKAIKDLDKINLSLCDNKWKEEWENNLLKFKERINNTLKNRLKDTTKKLSLEEKNKELEELGKEAWELDKGIREIWGKVEKELEKSQENKKGLEECIKQIKDAQKKVESAQQNIERAQQLHAMTGFEVAANMFSCLEGMAIASQLAFGSFLWGGGFYGGGVILAWATKEGKWNLLSSGALLGGFVAPDQDIEMGHCSGEQPLRGVNPNETCRKCNEDPFRICTRERCEILGNCIAVPTEKGDQYTCIPGKCEELGLPLFTLVNVSWYVGEELKGSTFKSYGKGDNINIKLNDNKPIPFNTNLIVINLTTNMLAQCRYILDKINASFSEMQDFENNYFPATPRGEPAWQQAYIMIPGDLSKDMPHRIFIKCKNPCGVEPKPSYEENIITFVLEKKPDQLPPEIVYVDPASGSVVRGDLGFLNASFWLDEIGTCKFTDKSINFTVNYTQMIKFGKYNNENSSVIDGGCYNARCLDRNETCSRCWLYLNLSRGYEKINYTGEFNETKMYHLAIRCNDVKGNIMTEESVLDYVLMTAPPYNINITKPLQEERTYERQPEIEVSSERATECRYKIFEYTPQVAPRCDAISPSWNEMWIIDQERGTLHRGKHNETLNASRSGTKHMLCVKCRDYWNMETIAKRDFFVLLDPDAPKVIRIYHDTTITDMLIIETDEEAECVYSNVNCNYNFSDGTQMMSTDKLLHGAPWQLKPYYIKCKDKWNNYPGNKPEANFCTVIVYPYEIP